MAILIYARKPMNYTYISSKKSLLWTNGKSPQTGGGR